MNRVVPYFKFLRPVRYAFAMALVLGTVRGVASGFGLPFASQKVFPILFDTSAPSTATLILVVSILPVAILVRGVSGYLLVGAIHLYRPYKNIYEKCRERFLISRIHH